MVSLIMGGYLADGLIKKGYSVINVRKGVNSVGFWFCIVSIFDFIDFTNVVILLCLINVCSGICAGGFGVNHLILVQSIQGHWLVYQEA